MRAESRSPASACRCAPHTADCSGDAPRAASPAIAPASTSPLPDVPRPLSPLWSTQARPSGATMHDRIATTVPSRDATARAASRSSSGASPSRRYDASVRLGVATMRLPMRPRSSSSMAPQVSANASSTIMVSSPTACRTPRTRSRVRSGSRIPGPSTRAVAPSSSGVHSATASAPSAPDDVTGSGVTADSGTATARLAAVPAAVASVSFPAPTRSAASPASSTAPGVSIAPPMTTTVPRALLPPSSSTSGSGQSRSSWLLTTSFMCGHRRTGIVLDRCRVVEDFQLQTGLAACVRRHAAVDDLPRERDRLLRRQRLHDVTRHEDGHVVTDHQHPLVGVITAEVAQRVPDAQRDVRPRLAAGRPVPELPWVRTPLRLLRIVAADAVPGQPVQHTLLTVAQPLVANTGEVLEPRCREQVVRRLLRADVRRHDHHRRLLRRREVAKTLAECLRLAHAEVGQLDRRVVDREVQPLSLLGVGALVRDVADALPMAHQSQRRRPGIHQVNLPACGAVMRRDRPQRLATVTQQSGGTPSRAAVTVSLACIPSRMPPISASLRPQTSCGATSTTAWNGQLRSRTHPSSRTGS